MHIPFYRTVTFLTVINALSSFILITSAKKKKAQKKAQDLKSTWPISEKSAAFAQGTQEIGFTFC